MAGVPSRTLSPRFPKVLGDVRAPFMVENKGNEWAQAKRFTQLKRGRCWDHLPPLPCENTAPPCNFDKITLLERVFSWKGGIPKSAKL
jgi:hypothetical protein